MAIEGTAAAVPLSPRERVHGLNHIAELRAKVFGLNIEPELERFISDMRNSRDKTMNKITAHWRQSSLWRIFRPNVKASMLMT